MNSRLVGTGRDAQNALCELRNCFPINMRAPKSPQDYSITLFPVILLEDSDGVVDRFTIGIESIESEECFMSRVPIVNAGVVIE